MIDPDFSFTTHIWMYHGRGAWHFVTLPKEETEHLKFLASHQRRSWGSLPVVASIGETMWQTSLFLDTKAGAYLLPVKADVRKKEHIEDGSLVTVQFKLGMLTEHERAT